MVRDMTSPGQTKLTAVSTCGHPNRSPPKRVQSPYVQWRFYCRICFCTTRKTRPGGYTLWLNTSKKIDPALHLTTNQLRWEGEKKGLADSDESTFAWSKAPKGKAILKGHYTNNWKTDTYIKMNILSLTQPTLALPNYQHHTHRKLGFWPLWGVVRQLLPTASVPQDR